MAKVKSKNDNQDQKPKDFSSKEIKQEAVSNVSAQGDINIGDIHQIINQSIQKGEIEFFSRTDFDKFKSPYFPKPKQFNEILDHIQNRHVLLLGGSHADKLDLAWYFAIHLNLSIQGSSKICGWEATSDARRLIEAIRRESSGNISDEEATKIFVLINLDPQDIKLEALQKIAGEHNIFVIAATESPQEKWSLSESEKRSWHDSTELSYQSEVLAQAALARIPEGITINAETETELHKLVAEQLDTVTGVDACIDWLRNCKQEISSNDLITAIHSAKEDKKERLKKWFRALDSREQSLALGITLLNGLYTDQFFSALERVVEQVWQKKDPSLQAIDHGDLESLGNYCEFSEVIKSDDFVIRRLTWKNPETGKLLLAIAWESHRRQIIIALEEIVRIIRDSAQGNLNRLSDWQIYGNPRLQKRLYEGISEPFADVGLVTAEATSPVRDLLAALASDSEFMVQNFAATVLSYWYQSDDGKLLRTLHFFYEIAIDNQQDPDSISRRNHIEATVALAISYASLNDLPNQLHPQLCDWLTTLSNSKNYLVRTYFGVHTLTYVVPRHLPQIHSILKGIAEKQSDLSFEIAQSLAAAYENYPDQVLEYLKAWKKDRKKHTLLCTIARAYGLINCTIYPDKLTPETAFELLETILKDAKSPIVRKAVIEGMSNRLKQDCLAIALKLLVQVSKFNKTERNQFISHLTEIYLVQRAQLTGGEGFCEVDKIRYRIWINTRRPLTDIENVLRHWLGQNKNRTAQQIATQAAIEFAKALDIGEDAELSRLRSAQSLFIDGDRVLQEDNSDPWHENWLAPVAAWLATLQEKVYQPVIQNILPEALIHHTDYRVGMDFVLRKWEQSPNQSIDNRLELKPTANFLRRGLWVMDNKVPLIIVGASAAILGLMTVQTFGNQIISLLQRPDPTQSAEAPRAIDGGISIVDTIGVSDIDSSNFDKGELKVSFTADGTPDDLISILNRGKGARQISINGDQVFYSNKVIGSFTEGNGEKSLLVKLNAEATSEATEALLQNIAYKNNSATVPPGSRTVQFELSDGSGGISKPLIRKISLIGKNQPPAIAAPESLSVKEGSTLNYGKVEISDPDSQTVTVQLSTENGIISLKGNIPKGLKAEEIGGNASKAIELRGSLEKIKATLANPSAITYKPNSDFAGDDSLKITVADDGPTIQDKAASLVWPPDAQQSQKASKIIKIAVIPKNQFPIISLPENKAVDEDNDLKVGGIVIKDPDSKDDGEPIAVILSVTNGSLKVKPNTAGGLKANGINGSPSSSVILKGTISTINATLADPAAIIYRGKQNYNGSDSLQIRVDDGGRGAEKALAITITPVNDAPHLGTSKPVKRALEEPLTRPNPNDITQEEALSVIRGYLRAKREIFAPPFSRETAARYTTGVLYADIVQPGKAIDSLTQKNQYYQYGNQQLEFLGGFVSSANKVILNVLIAEEVTLYKNGTVKSPAKNNPKSYQFDLRLENNTWKIFDYKEIN